MDAAIVTQLREICRRFYEEFAAAYSDSRHALQPGIPRALGQLGQFDSLLDLGCGDGRVGWEIAGGLLGRKLERYVGVDQSVALLNQRGTIGDGLASWRGVVADVCEADWPSKLGDERFDAAICLSALHHVPSHGLRVRVLSELRARVDGPLAVSVWQLSHQERFQRRLVDWGEVGIDPARLEAGDLLLDWQRGGRGIRYVHEFDEARLRGTLEEAGFRPREAWRSDGKSGDLGLYVIAD